RDDVSHAPAIVPQVDKLGRPRHNRRRAAVLQFVADVDDDVYVLWKSERLNSSPCDAAHPEIVALGEIAENLPDLRDWRADQLGQLDGLVDRLGVVKLIADNHQRASRFDEKFGGALYFFRIGPYAHARVNFVVADDLGAHRLVNEIGMPGSIGRTVWWSPSGFKSAAHGFRNHVGAARQPSVLSKRLDDLLLIGHFFEAVASRAARRIRAI